MSENSNALHAETLKHEADTRFAEIKEIVAGILAEKNFSKKPQTIVQFFENLDNARRFYPYSENARERFEKIENALLKFTENLKAKEFETASKILRENELDTETMYKRALIHASHISQLAITRQKFARMEKELSSKIEDSLSKIPFSQREEFNRLLGQLSDAEIESVKDETE